MKVLSVKRRKSILGDIGMNARLLKILIISLSLGSLPTVQAAVIKTAPKSVSSSVVTDRQSPIEKALDQQKRGDNKQMLESDQLKVLTSMNSAPTQNFLADQHQRFSRLLQSLFQPHSS